MMKDYFIEKDFWDDWDQVFYHGTSDVLLVSAILPAIETGMIREDWRKNLTDKVFLTNSICSAEKYAKKAANKFGGAPIVYVVNPVGEVWRIRENEFVTDRAEIISVVNNGNV